MSLSLTLSWALRVGRLPSRRDIRMLMRYAHPMRQRIIEQMDKGELRRPREK